jgi:hypothetical protein
MHLLNRAQVTIRFLALLIFASAPRNLAIAHEGHQMECKKTSMQAIKADIQAMKDKKDMDACKTHMHNAMDAMDK